MNRRVLGLPPRISLILPLAWALACSNGTTASPATASAGPEIQPASAAEIPSPPQRFVTRHAVNIGGQRVPFTATAGETYLYSDDGEVIAAVFSYAYVKGPAMDVGRPVLFLTNGGPGSASNALQVGGFGPWSVTPDRLAVLDGQNPSSTPPFDLVENQNSLLDVADLVFVDPVGTGYSRALGAGSNSDFWGIDEDAESMAQFIQIWVTENGRWNSPKFFMGESYGGYRAGPLVRALMAGPSYLGYLRGITLNGVIILGNNLLGPFGGLEGFSREVSTAMEFPSYALTAWYHQTIDRQGRSPEAYFEEARQFAENEYLPALRKEAAAELAPEARASIVASLTALTGLPPGAYAETLSLPRGEFSRLLLADRGLMVGAYDSRYTLPLEGAGADPVSDDPSLSHVFPVLAGAQANLEHDKLGVKMARPYVSVHWRDLLPSWNMSRLPSAVPGLPGYQGTAAGELAAAMVANENLFLMFGTGYFDLVMSAAGTQYTVDHTAFPQDRVVAKAYEAGHEIYTGEATGRLAEDVRDFIRRAAAH
jgi:carboxypeptidase C (cathepsin A)